MMLDALFRFLIKGRDRSSAGADKLRPDQQISIKWDVSQERSFIENLLNQRFNFLIIFFSIFVGFASNKDVDPTSRAILLSVGATVSCMLMATIGRAQKKLDILIKLLEEDPAHPVAITTQAAGPRGSARRLVGHTIPWICFATLAAWSITLWAGLLGPPTENWLARLRPYPAPLPVHSGHGGPNPAPKRPPPPLRPR